jgi:hypothetical protein
MCGRQMLRRSSREDEPGRAQEAQPDWWECSNKDCDYKDIDYGQFDEK